MCCSLVLYALFLHRSNFYHYVDCHILTCLWRKINELNCLYFFARTLKSRFFPTNLKFAYCAALRVAWFPLGVFAEAVGGGERAARNSCWWQGARATTRLSFLVVADTSSTASVHLGYSPPLPNKNSLFGGASFFYSRICKTKNATRVFPRRFSQRFSDFLEEQRHPPWFWISSKSSPSSRWQVRLLTFGKSPKHKLSTK